MCVRLESGMKSSRAREARRYETLKRPPAAHVRFRGSSAYTAFASEGPGFRPSAGRDCDNRGRPHFNGRWGPGSKSDSADRQISIVWEALAIAIAALAVAVFLDGLRVRETAIRIAREACGDQGLQFLDDTVQGARTRLARDAAGHARLRRTYLFEFSDDGVGRRSGSVVMLGNTLESLQFEPYRVS